MFRRSVARYCLAHAKCPVLAVPPSALMDEMGHGLRSWQLRRHALHPGHPGDLAAGFLAAHGFC